MYGAAIVDSIHRASNRCALSWSAHTQHRRFAGHHHCRASNHACATSGMTLQIASRPSRRDENNPSDGIFRFLNTNELTQCWLKTL